MQLKTGSTLTSSASVLFDIAGDAGRGCGWWFVSDITAGDHSDADGDAGSMEP